MDSLEELRERVLKEYEQKVVPMKGRVLVKSLGKEVWYKDTIILPDSPVMQHKPVYEGIVLEVYKQYMQQIKINGKWEDMIVEPEVKVGDHILYPHWEGVANQRFVAEDIRFIAESSILAVLEYERKPGQATRPLTTSGFSREKG